MEKEPGRKVNRAPVKGWVEVPDVPYRGHRPRLSKDTPAATKAWWAAISTMPHCVLWSASDWQFALDSARLHAAIAGGELRWSAELRAREKMMGTTLKAREALKIRYVDAPAIEAAASTPPMAEEDAARWRAIIDAD